MSAQATEDANKLLEQYSAEKKRRSPMPRRPRGASGDMNGAKGDLDLALVDGATLGNTYSHSKKQFKTFTITPTHPGSSYSHPSEGSSIRSDEAVDAVRRALSELNDLEAEVPLQAKGRIPKITRLLQDIEGHLEAEDVGSLPLDYAKKIIFSPADSVSKMKSFDESFTADSDLPLDSGTPTGKHVLKVYMNNQLELQQSEWEKYEEAFNTLDEKLAETEEQLRVMTEERDKLLQQLREPRENQNDQLNQLVRDLESANAKRAELENEYDKLSESNEEKKSLLARRDTELKELSTNFITITTQLKEAQEQLQHLTSTTANDVAILFDDNQLLSGVRNNLSQEELDHENAKYEEYDNLIEGLQQELDATKLTLTQTIQENEEFKMEKTSLTDEIANLSEDLRKSDAKMEQDQHLEKQLLELRQSYETLFIEYEVVKSGAVAAIDETEIINLRRELETSRCRLEEFASRELEAENKMKILVTEKNSQAQQFQALTMHHNALMAQFEELQKQHVESERINRHKIEEFQLEKQVHQQEVAKFLEKISVLETQNERKDASILRMRKLFSQEDGPHDHDEIVFSSSADESPPRSPLRSSSKDDCDRIIDSMEKKVDCHLPPLSSPTALLLFPQMRVQVHNLQSLQDALSEEKVKTKKFSEQKRELKERIAELESQLTELKTESATAIGDLKSQLQHSTSLVQSLQTENNDLRYMATVNNPPPAQCGNEAVVLPNGGAEELFQKVKSLEQEILESKSHSDSLENSLQKKANTIEALTQEIVNLRSTVTSSADELVRIKSESLRNEASLEAQLLEKEREVKESSQRLKEFLLILNEKDTTNEEFISQLQEQVRNLSLQLEKAEEAKLSSDAKNFVLMKQLSDAEERIRQFDLLFREEQKESTSVTASVTSRERELSTKIQVRDMLLSDRDHDNQQLRSTLDDYDTVMANHQEIIRELETEKTFAEEELLSYKRSSRFIYEEALYFHERYEKELVSLQQTVERSCEEYSQRIEYLMRQLQVVTDAFVNRGDELENLKADVEILDAENKKLVSQSVKFEEELMMSQQKALHFESLVEKNEILMSEMRFKLETKEMEQDHNMDGNLPALSAANVPIPANGKSHPQPTQLQEFVDRFEMLEKRAVEMSSQGAKQFARAAKGMAILEAENFQLKSLVDHFRLVNAKLLGDIKIASSSNISSNSVASMGGSSNAFLQNNAETTASVMVRYQMLEEEFQISNERCAQLEAEVHEKDRQLLKLLESSHLEDERRTDSFEEELRAEKERSMSLQDQINSQLRSITRLTNLIESLQKQLENEMESSANECESLKRELGMEMSRREEVEQEIEKLQSQLQEINYEKNEMEKINAKKVKLYLEKEEEWNSKSLRFEEERQSSRERIEELERSFEENRMKLMKVEDENYAQENKLESVKGQLHDSLVALEELESKYQSLEFTFEQQTLSLQQKETKILDLMRYLEEVRQQVEIRDDDVRTLTSKLNKSEDRTKKVLLEKNLLESSLEELRYKNDSLLDESVLMNSRLEEMQIDVNEAREKVEKMEDELVKRENEILTLKSKNEILIREKGMKEKELKSLENVSEDVKLKSSRLLELESLLSTRENEMEEMKNSKDRILMEMQAVIMRFESLLVASSQEFHSQSQSRFSSHRDVSGESEMEGSVTALQFLRSSDPYDLLTTPLKYALTPSRDLISATQLRSIPFPEVELTNPPADPPSSMLSLHGLSDIRNHFEKMVVLADEHLNRFLQLEDAHAGVHQQLTETKRGYEVLDQKYRSVITERDAILSSLKSSENELASLTEELETVMVERDNARRLGEDQSQWLRHIRRDLSQIISNEIVIRATSVAVTLLGDDSPLDLILPLDHHSNGTLIEAANGDSTPHPVMDQVHEASSVISKLCSALQQSKVMITKDDQTIKKLESLLNQSNQRSENDKQKLQSHLHDVSAALEREQTVHSQLKNEFQKQSSETMKLQNLLTEYSTQNNELHEDLKSCIGNNIELKNTLKEAEVLCGDLRGRIQVLVREKEELLTEISSFQTENSVLLTKITNLEIQVEQWSTDMNRIRAERDALAETRSSLQAQLDSVRAEANVVNERFRAANRHSDDELRATFELERLLAVFGATLDHLQTTFETAADSSESTSVLLLENGNTSTSMSTSFNKRLNLNTLSSSASSTAAAVTISITDRVEQTVRRLTELRSWSRDDRRLRRQLEDKILSLEQELDSVMISTKLENDELRLSISNFEMKEKESHLKLSEFEAIRTQVMKLEDELGRQRRDKELLLSTLDSDKKSLYSASSTLQDQDLELQKFQEQLHKKEMEIEDLVKSSNEMRNSNLELLSSLELKEESLRSLKALNGRLQDTLERQEGNLERVRKEKNELERKMKGIHEEHQLQLDGVREHSKVTEKELKEMTRQYHDLEKKSQEDHSNALAEIQELKGKLHSLELRHQQTVSEAGSYRKECTNTAQELSRLQSKYEKEAIDHQKVLASLSSLQQREESWRLRAEGSTVLIEEEETRAKHAEERISQLVDQISELTSQLKQRDNSLSVEREKRLGVEQDLQRQSILLERTQRELTTQSSKSSALRAEGRKARKEIVQAAEYLREVAGILQASVAHSADVTLRLTNESLSYDLENIDTSPTQRSLHSIPRHPVSSAGASEGKEADPLGIKEISSVFETIKNLTQIVRQIPQNQLSLESTVRRYDTENQRLQRELDGVQVVYEDRIQRLESENRLLEEQVRSLKNREIGKLEETRTVSQLQHENNLLRAKCDRADQKEKELLLEIASFSEYSSKTDRGGAQQPQQQHSSSEMDQLQREIRALQQELDAVRHHRTVLQDSVSQLELLVYRDSDEYHSSQKYSVTGAEAGDLDQLVLQVNRLERKQQSLDELIAVYRKGLLGLYPDGSFYGSTQYTSLKSAHGFQGAGNGAGSGWIEREIELITKSYVVEIEVLEKYSGSLSARVRQGESYCSELRVRLEDTLRALYKNGKNYTNEILSHQLEHLAVELTNSQQKVVSLTQEVSTLSRQGRLRHEQLVEEITKALQSKDDALRRLRQVEGESKRAADASYQSQQEIIKELNECKSTISQLRIESDQLTRSIKEKDRAIIQLRRELIDVDTQLDSERRKRAAMRASLEKSSAGSSSSQKRDPSGVKTPAGNAERTPTSFRLSVRSPPLPPSPYTETKPNPDPLPAQTPEIHSSSSRDITSATSRHKSQLQQFQQEGHRSSLQESRTILSSSRSGSAPHGSRIKSKFLETKQVTQAAPEATNHPASSSVLSPNSHRGGSSRGLTPSSRTTGIPSWELPSHHSAQHGTSSSSSSKRSVLGGKGSSGVGR